MKGPHSPYLLHPTPDLLTLPTVPTVPTVPTEPAQPMLMCPRPLRCQISVQEGRRHSRWQYRALDSSSSSQDRGTQNVKM